MTRRGAPPRTDEQKERRRAEYHQRIANGLCGMCGKPRDRHDRNSCDDCIAKANRRSSKSWQKNHEQRAIDGTCTYCGKADPVPGRKLCAECSAKHRKYQEGRSQLPHVRQYHKNYRRGIRQEVLDAYGSVCACCGESTYEFLTIDHINNDGAEHRRKRTGFSSTNSSYLWNIKREGFPPIFQVLCWNCNAAKGFHKVCPHQQQIEAKAA